MNRGHVIEFQFFQSLFFQFQIRTGTLRRMPAAHVPPVYRCQFAAASVPMPVSCQCAASMHSHLRLVLGPRLCRALRRSSFRVLLEQMRSPGDFRKRSLRESFHVPGDSRQTVS